MQRHLLGWINRGMVEKARQDLETNIRQIRVDDRGEAYMSHRENQEASVSSYVYTGSSGDVFVVRTSKPVENLWKNGLFWSRHFRKLLEVARFSPRDVTMAKIVGTNKLPSSPPSPAGRSLWAVRAQRKGNHCRYFIFFQKSGRPMFCSCLVFYLTIFLLPDLEKRDENQEIGKTKVSGGRMTDNFWRSVWNPIQVLFILKVLWIKVLINPNL